ncbi:type II toxin-antitoxin system RelE/ParE family toxin [uncultured Brevundimonas sp.]|uniref:type II toxin-antitoxin system RelE family toxin n=1 Tax=uncultured Brevundimonas sp. TaxID=213418 RepID=UPI0026136FC3|nr:type II toxin-antitoxin system RelE/ParE family toxin [uncultured Brevundimonas sp.]
MAWTIEYRDVVEKQLSRLDRQTARRITDFLEVRLAAMANPRDLGQALSGPLKSYWRYRVGDHRVICEIHDQRLVVLVLKIGDRKEVYR